MRPEISSKRITDQISDEGSFQCLCCGRSKKNCVDVFELIIGSSEKAHVFRLCDECLDKVLSASLSGIVEMNGRVKSQRDLQVILSRNKMRYNFEKQENEKRKDPWSGVLDEEEFERQSKKLESEENGEDDPWSEVEDEE